MSADGIDGRRVELLVNDKTLPVYPAGIQRAEISLAQLEPVSYKTGDGPPGSSAGPSPCDAVQLLSEDC
jgi:hypothetical protein